MKHSRLKKAQKFLSFYSNYFQYRPPYQVLVDATFCQAALQNKIAITDQLNKYFQCQVKLVTSQCIILEAESFGSQLLGATLIAKTFQVHKCGHEGQPKTGAVCIKEMIKSSKYFVATQDRNLQHQLRRIPGQGLIYLHKIAPILEAPSLASKQHVQKTNQQLVSIKEREKKAIDLLKKVEGAELSISKEIKKQKKRAKGPNPLSCRKKKKKN